MEWTGDATGRQYMLIQGAYSGLVWRTSTGEWNALLSANGPALYHTRCGRLQEAQAWMEARLRELVRDSPPTDTCRD